MENKDKEKTTVYARGYLDVEPELSMFCQLFPRSGTVLKTYIENIKTLFRDIENKHVKPPVVLSYLKPILGLALELYPFLLQYTINITPHAENIYSIDIFLDLVEFKDKTFVLAIQLFFRANEITDIVYFEKAVVSFLETLNVYSPPVVAYVYKDGMWRTRVKKRSEDSEAYTLLFLRLLMKDFSSIAVLKSLLDRVSEVFPVKVIFSEI